VLCEATGTAATGGKLQVAGATGFEPVAFGFGVEFEQFPADPRESLSVVSARESDPARSLPSLSILGDHGNFGAPVVHGNAAPRGVKLYLLTVREVASLLHVSRATVYSLCERGHLAYTRVGASIRIHHADVELLLRPARVTNR
jgi:excisionase family DNA binding protein